MNYITKYDATKPKCYTPYPIVKNGTTGGSYVTFLESIGLGTIKNFGLDLKTISGNQNQQSWHDGVNNITSWSDLFTAIDEHFKVLYAKINATPITPTIPTLSIQPGTGTNQYTTSQGINASWSVTGGLSCGASGINTTISGPKGSFTLKSNNSSSVTINSGSSITINIKYVPQTTSGTLTASANGYNSDSRNVSYTPTTPTSVTLTGLSTATVNLTNGEGSITITPSSSGSVGVSGYSGSLSVTISTPQPEAKPYYYYVGLTQPDSSTVISNAVGKGQQGWHLIGDTLSGYSLSNPIYNGGNPADCINLNAEYNDVDYYIALPNGVCLRDGSGTDHSSEYLIQSGVTINSRTYNIFKDHFSDFMFIVY